MQFTFGGNGVGGGGAGSIRPPFRFGGATGRSTGGGIFGKPIPRIRASQKTSLETVEGSPVKGAASTVGRRRDGNESGEEGISIAPLNLQSTPVNATTINKGGDMSISTDGGKTEESGGTPDNMQTNGKELKKISKLNASRRASLAFSALTQSLNTPDSGEDRNENGPLGAGRSPAEPPSAGKQRAASATFSSSRPVRAASMRSFGVVNTAAGLSRSQSETMASAGPSAAPAAFNVSDSEGDSRSGKKGATGRSKMPGSLDILDQCTIFVDVRTEEGEDAGALFVDMLRGLGAKVLTRIGQSCTHIVYKNGLASTLTRYRLFDEPRPSVVGIGWVVECVEKRERVDETRHQVNLDGVNVAGTLKRRKSILPKQMSMNGPMDAFINGAIPTGSEKTVVNGDRNEDGESSRDNINGSNLKSNLAPLEKARRRSTMFPRPLNG
ncbi:hypothetical protein DFH11DRAFT_1507873 [Phellopilus nigrolimitatus]|nr:hypothetical protein DFH11DRAFT_1507873 [Phellopilus nigrolimitatus]